MARQAQSWYRGVAGSRALVNEPVAAPTPAARAGGRYGCRAGKKEPMSRPDGPGTAPIHTAIDAVERRRARAAAPEAP